MFDKYYYSFFVLLVPRKHDARIFSRKSEMRRINRVCLSKIFAGKTGIQQGGPKYWQWRVVGFARRRGLASGARWECHDGNRLEGERALGDECRKAAVVVLAPGFSRDSQCLDFPAPFQTVNGIGFGEADVCVTY